MGVGKGATPHSVPAGGGGYCEEGRRAHLKFRDICSPGEETLGASRLGAPRPARSAGDSRGGTPARLPSPFPYPQPATLACGAQRRGRQARGGLAGWNSGAAVLLVSPQKGRIRTRRRAVYGRDHKKGGYGGVPVRLDLPRASTERALPPYTLTCRPRNHTLIFSHFCEHR